MYTTLISARELADLLENGAESDAGVCVFDCRFNLADTGAGFKAWQEGHIPGARYAHLDEHLSSPVIPGRTGRHPLPDKAQLLDWLQKSGVGEDTQIIAYDDCNGGMAARLWWLSRWIGHRPCAVLDGGIQAWQKIDSISTATPANQTAGNLTVRPSLAGIVSSEEIEGNDALLLVDARDRERYLGDVEPIDPIAGHIPGAICLPFTANTAENGRFLSVEQLHKRFDLLTEQFPDKTPVMYCGSGVTAAHNVLAMVHAGFETPALYADSWSGWICDPERPVALGD